MHREVARPVVEGRAVRVLLRGGPAAPAAPAVGAPVDPHPAAAGEGHRVGELRVEERVILLESARVRQRREVLPGDADRPLDAVLPVGDEQRPVARDERRPLRGRLGAEPVRPLRAERRGDRRNRRVGPRRRPEVVRRLQVLEVVADHDHPRPLVQAEALALGDGIPERARIPFVDAPHRLVGKPLRPVPRVGLARAPDPRRHDDADAAGLGRREAKAFHAVRAAHHLDFSGDGPEDEQERRVLVGRVPEKQPRRGEVLGDDLLSFADRDGLVAPLREVGRVGERVLEVQFDRRQKDLPAETRIGHRAVVAHRTDAVRRQDAADGERVDAVDRERRLARPVLGARRGKAVLDIAERHLQAAGRVLDEEAVADLPAEVAEPVVALPPAAVGGRPLARPLAFGEGAVRQVPEQTQEERVARLLARHEGRADAEGRVEDAPLAGAALDHGVRPAVVAEEDAAAGLRLDASERGERRVAVAARPRERMARVRRHDAMARRQVLERALPDGAREQGRDLRVHHLRRRVERHAALGHARDDPPDECGAPLPARGVDDRPRLVEVRRHDRRAVRPLQQDLAEAPILLLVPQPLLPPRGRRVDVLVVEGEEDLQRVRADGGGGRRLRRHGDEDVVVAVGGGLADLVRAAHAEVRDFDAARAADRQLRRAKRELHLSDQDGAVAEPVVAVERKDDVRPVAPGDGKGVRVFHGRLAAVRIADRHVQARRPPVEAAHGEDDLVVRPRVAVDGGDRQPARLAGRVFPRRGQPERLLVDRLEPVVGGLLVDRIERPVGGLLLRGAHGLGKGRDAEQQADDSLRHGWLTSR